MEGFNVFHCTEQQLLALARCLCGHPRMMLLDESAEAIQHSILEEMVDRLKVLRTPGLSLVLVKQNLDCIAALSDRVLCIQKGVVTGQMAAEDLKIPKMVSEVVGISTA